MYRTARTTNPTRETPVKTSISKDILKFFKIESMVFIVNNGDQQMQQWIKKTLVFLGLIAPAQAYALDFGDHQELHVLSLNEFDMEGYQIKDHRDVYFPYANAPSDQEYWQSGIASMMNIDLISYKLFSVYWDGRVFGDATDVQFRETGLQYETGLAIKDYVKVWFRHESDHILDAEGNGRFPLTNEIGVTLTLYKRDRDWN